jgi:hypothetical protein
MDEIKFCIIEFIGRVSKDLKGLQGLLIMCKATC